MAKKPKSVAAAVKALLDEIEAAKARAALARMNGK
jgi:hypothetical protein